MHRPHARPAACRPRRRALGWVALILGLLFLAATLAYLPSAPNGWIVTGIGGSIAGLGVTALADPRARVPGSLAIVCGLLGTALLTGHAYTVQQAASQVAVPAAGAAVTQPTPAAQPVAASPAVTRPATTSSAELAVRTAMLQSLQQVRDRLAAYRGTAGDWPAVTMNSDGVISISDGAHAGAVLGYAPAGMSFVYSSSVDGMQFSVRLTSMKYPMESVAISSASAVAQSG